MNKNKIAVAFAICGLFVLGVFLYLNRSNSENVPSFNEATTQSDQQKVQELLSQDKIDEAFKIIHNYEHQLSVNTQIGLTWLHLLIEATQKTNNYAQMVFLYETYPQAFIDNEKASIIAADGYLLEGNAENYQKIRNAWKQKSTMPETWFILDADALQLEGKKDEAIKQLLSQKLEGKKEIDRLLRLAFLNANDQPKKAWDYLEEAYQIDPQNSTVISYRGKLMEALGQPSVALYEYLAAVAASPNDLMVKDQLAEYYMRQGQVAPALTIWLETLSRPSLDLIWIKVLFWSKVIMPLTVDWSKASPPTGPDRPFIDYLISLPQGVFWDEYTFEKLSDYQKYLSHLQATFWLRLLELLKKEKEKEAYTLLKFNQFSQHSTNPQLEETLKNILSYRLYGSFKNELQKTSTNTTVTNQNNSFFNQINTIVHSQSDERSQLPSDLQAFLASKEIFSAIFLSAGWLEAALQLHQLEVFPDNFPEWDAYGMTQALRTNRSPSEALAFASKQKKTPALSVLMAEIYMADQKSDIALVLLKPYLQDISDTGFRASWLASIIYIDKKQFEKAKEVIEGHPKLAKDPLGKEGLARIALLQGNTELAEKLYGEIQNQSAEALSYFARRAFAQKDWKKAQEITEKLILLYPDNLTLRANLNQILEEAKKSNSLQK